VDGMLDSLLNPTLGIELAVTFAVALAMSSLGFARLVYFVNLGYALSIAGGAVLALGRGAAVLDLPVALHLVLLGVYGVRLGSYVYLREKEPAYQRELADVQEGAVGITWPKKVLIWVGVSVLYVLMLTPAQLNLQHLRDGHASSRTLWVGVAVMALGLLLEALADRQKTAFKREKPHRFCDVKLYRVVRCPNYLGEIVFWVGNFVAGVHALKGFVTWAFAASGLVCIVLIMMGATKRLERNQDERYGSDPEYQQYIRTVPVLFPLVPLYSLKNVRVFLE
jgi:steroid 5-alpha reductase family enzyme